MEKLKNIGGWRPLRERREMEYDSNLEDKEDKEDDLQRNLCFYSGKFILLTGVCKIK